MRAFLTLAILAFPAMAGLAHARPAFQAPDTTESAERVREMRERAVREAESIPLAVPLPLGASSLSLIISEGLAPWATEQLREVMKDYDAQTAEMAAEEAARKRKAKQKSLLNAMSNAEARGDHRQALTLFKAYVRTYANAPTANADQGAQRPKPQASGQATYRVSGRYCMGGHCTNVSHDVAVLDRGYRLAGMSVPLNGGFTPNGFTRLTGTHPGYSGESVSARVATAGNSFDLTIDHTYAFRGPDWTSSNASQHKYRFVASGAGCSFDQVVTTRSSYSRPVLGKTSESHEGRFEMASCQKR